MNLAFSSRHPLAAVLAAALVASGCVAEAAPDDATDPDSVESDLTAPCAGAACATVATVTEPAPFLESVGGALFWLEQTGIDSGYAPVYSLRTCRPSANDCGAPKNAATFTKATELLADGERLLVVTRHPLTVRAFDPKTGAIFVLTTLSANEGQVAVDPDGQSYYVLTEGRDQTLHRCPSAGGGCSLIAADSTGFKMGAYNVVATSNRVVAGGIKLFSFAKGTWERSGGSFGGPPLITLAVSARDELFTSEIVADPTRHTILREGLDGRAWDLEGEITGMGSRGIKAARNFLYAGAQGHGDVFGNGNGFVYRLSTVSGIKRVAAIQQKPIAVAVDTKAVYWIDNRAPTPSIRMTKR